MSKIREMVDTFSPPIGLLVKLGSLIVHAEEGHETGHEMDWIAFRSLLADREVQQWMESMGKKGFLPKKRN